LTISGVAKSFGGRRLLAEASLQVNRQDRIGLVGPNGAGKTTLFLLILQSESPDAGTISLQRGVTLGYLPQESVAAPGETLLELATALSKELAALQRQLKENRAVRRDSLEEYALAKARFAELGGFHSQAKAKRI